ncbi:GNAT family N-acetyltransferase [Streptomyces coeruleorubidus]|uniref:GNAT family N-acetyltransferase n=1 Tax=Streptomyces coeruleorubidus TaxID=116188 RepID=UPI003693DF35
MDGITTRLTAAATASAPALLLRPWRPADAADLVDLHRDEALRRWVSAVAHDRASAARWVRDQQRGWEAGHRFAFAVSEVHEHTTEGEHEHTTEGKVVGHAVLKNVAPGASSAEVGYWTAAQARGRGVAPRALRALTDWAFTTFTDSGLTRLELLHQADNTASCRVARKCGYELSSLRPAAPPEFPLEGHVHARARDL